MHHRCKAILLGIAALLAGCSVRHDPAKTVTVEIRGIMSDADREQINKSLEETADSTSRLRTSSWSNDLMTVQLSPVSDVEAFSKKITFGTVTEVKDRTVKVDFVK